jgi:hypothetical protein
MSTAEPEGFTLRPAQLSDVPAIYDLFQSHERALYGHRNEGAN